MRKSTAPITSLAVCASISFGVAALFSCSSADADQVVLQNGDILNGKVLDMTTNALVLQDESLGTLSLPRAKVSNITLGVVAAAAPPLIGANATSLNSPVQLTSQPQTQSASQPNSSSDPDLAAMAREIQSHSNLVQEVEAQVMGSSASPEADNKFNELLNELSSGQLDMNGLRSQAQSAADQLQEYKKEMGPDAGEEVDGYLSILNNFLRETAPTNGP